MIRTLPAEALLHLFASDVVATFGAPACGSSQQLRGYRTSRLFEAGSGSALDVRTAATSQASCLTVSSKQPLQYSEGRFIPESTESS